MESYTTDIRIYDPRKPHIKIITENLVTRASDARQLRNDTSIVYLHMVEHHPAKRRCKRQQCTSIGIRFTAIVWIIN